MGKPMYFHNRATNFRAPLLILDESDGDFELKMLVYELIEVPLYLMG